MGHRGTVRVGTLVAVIAIQALAPMSVQAGTTVDLDQWASSDKAWQNGNLNGNNSRYPEGGIVPFRLALEGLKAGEHRIHINYDVTAGGHKAYDFLATWNVTNAKGAICDKGGGARSSMCPSLPSSSSFAFPSDGTKLNGLSIKGAEAYSGAPRRLTIWGGTILAIGAVQHDGSPNGNSTGDMVVRFRSTGSAVLLAWGGHLAQSDYWDVAGGGGARRRRARVRGAMAHAHAAARRLGQQEPGSEHPAQRDRRDAGAAGPGADAATHGDTGAPSACADPTADATSDAPGARADSTPARRSGRRRIRDRHAAGSGRAGRLAGARPHAAGHEHREQHRAGDAGSVVVAGRRPGHRRHRRRRLPRSP